ncbi:MAG: protein serine/threonine phosphatase 2C family protein [Chlamydiales bacterium]|nr:protein serine/threonine phosphatase 2C family protein [Chlamydiales bacterium]
MDTTIAQRDRMQALENTFPGLEGIYYADYLNDTPIEELDKDLIGKTIRSFSDVERVSQESILDESRVEVCNNTSFGDIFTQIATSVKEIFFGAEEVLEEYDEASSQSVSSILDHAPHNAFWTPRGETLSQEEESRKMQKNFAKAIREHIEGATPGELGVYATIEESLDVVVDDTILTFSQQHYEALNKKYRPTMEDAHLFVEVESGMLAAVFDGHLGSIASNYAALQFKERFPAKLAECKGDVFRAFESLIDEIHSDIIDYTRRDIMSSQGSTAVITFIDKTTHLAYTATLGDSESNIYRKIGQQVKSVPLSVVRDWADQKEALRAAIALHDETIATKWPTITGRDIFDASVPCRKDLRFPPDTGTNVSRALGDLDKTTSETGEAGVIHKPKMTVAPVKAGDILVLACDGLKDYLQEDDIVDVVATSIQTDNIAKKLVRKALTTSQDNITVLVIRIS